MERVAVVAITKNGIKVGRRLATLYPGWHVHAPSKFSDDGADVMWFAEPTPKKLELLFGQYDGLVCIFSLGAVIRLLAPHLKDKKTDPAVLVIDDRCEFVISALSGHVGGANELARGIAAKTGATPVITTAADVNKTIAVDMVGRDLGWRIDGEQDVTRVSAMMVNLEKIGVYQDAGNTGALGESLPSNVTVYGTLAEMCESDCAGMLVITDRQVGSLPKPAVIYRPKSLIVGVGLHRDTHESKIRDSLAEVLGQNALSPMSVMCLASVKKPVDIDALGAIATELGVELRLLERGELAKLDTPNPSQTVARLEGTPSVSEAAALSCSNHGKLVVQKQKFPPDLTLAVARMAQ